MKICIIFSAIICVRKDFFPKILAEMFSANQITGFFNQPEQIIEISRFFAC